MAAAPSKQTSRSLTRRSSVSQFERSAARSPQVGEERSLKSNLFEVMKLLEERRLYFDVRRVSPHDVTLLVTLVGRRVEICVDEDDMIDVCVFEGDESVELGMVAVLKALDEDTPWPMRHPPRDDSVIATMLARDALVSNRTALAMFRAIVTERRG